MATMKWQLMGASLKGETEKALKVEAEIDTQAGRRGWTLWLPKSQTERTEDGGFVIPDWLVTAKETEIADRVTGFCGLEIARA